MSLTQEPPLDDVRLGDRIRWNCTFGRSRPRAQITWLINGEPVPSNSRRLLTTPPSLEEEEEEEESAEEEIRRLEWASSVLEVVVGERHLKNPVRPF